MGALLLAGSTALILFAVRFLRKGLDRLLATRLGCLAGRLATSPGRGFLAGGLLAAAAPSSSSMAAVTARLADEERVSPPAAMAVMLGANVGLTSLVLLGAAGVERWFPLLLAAGVGLFQFARGDLWRGLGQVVLSLGFVLLGMHLAREAVPALRGGDLDLVLAIAEGHPLVLAAAAALLTVAMQSSSATILLLICLAGAREMPVAAVVAAVAGANLGLAATGLGIAWRIPRSRLPMLGAALAKAAAALAALVLALAVPATAGGDAGTAAAAHLGITLAAAAAGLPLARPLLRRLAALPLLRPDAAAAPRYLGIDVAGDRRLALANSQREVVHVAERARAMLAEVWRAWRRGDPARARDAARLDDHIDDLDRDIRAYLAGIADRGDPEERREQLAQLRHLIRLEAIGDVVERQLAGAIARGLRHAAAIPADCRDRLDATCGTVLRTLLTAETAFASRDRGLAGRLLAAEAALTGMVRAERDRSLWRLRGGVPHAAEAVYLDLLAGLERINAGACALARDILDDDSGARHAQTA